MHRVDDRMTTQAVILAAGNGVRMKADIPKPLLKINSKELIIERNIKNLTQHDVDICLVINPRYEMLFRQKLGGYNLRYCYQEKALGTGNALYAAKDFVKDDLFLVMMGDDFIEFDLRKALNTNNQQFWLRCKGRKRIRRSETG